MHLDDEVARTLDRIGVSEGFLARSRPGSGLRLLDASHRVMAEFSRGHQASEHGFPQANMFHQPDLEELMLARIQRHPLISLRRGADVTGLDGAPDALTAAPVRVHARVACEPQTFTGRVVLGCDGANSTIRQLAGITMDDLGFTERWLVVDIKAEDRPGGLGRRRADLRPRQARHLHAHHRRQVPLGIPAGRRRGREVAMTPAARALLRPWTGRGDLDGLQIIRSATYTFRARLGIPLPGWGGSSCSVTPPTSPRRSSGRAWRAGCATLTTWPGSSPTCSPAGPGRTCSAPTTANAARTPQPW